MRRTTRLMLLVAALALPLLSAVAADTEGEISYLLEYVSNSGCTFNRNGVRHDSADAAEHLRLKYRRGSRYAQTAEQFIDRLASGSSWSGKPYSVTCDGSTEFSGTWLHQALTDYRTASQPTPP